tara:strand:+ start:1414 stop:2124 length:711 start_codon:yes stop_codon:yes gene_type:complete
MIVNTPAIVLKSISYGDTSIISRCFSKNKGKISIIVKGAKSKKAPKISYFQPLSYVELVYNEKPSRNLNILSKVSFIESWQNIFNDIRLLSLSVAILEITEKTILEGDPHPKLFKVLKNVLSAYNKNPDSPNLLFWFYECALLNHLGFRPTLEKQDFPGVDLPDPNGGSKSGAILEKLMEEKIDQLPKEMISKKDNKIISDYLWLLLCYHFDGLHNIKSVQIAKQILKPKGFSSGV